MENRQTEQQINEILRNNTQEWVEKVFEPYYKDCEKYRQDNKVGLSCPFYFALSDKYICGKQNGKKRLMIVGQEARGFGEWSRDGQKPGYEPKTSQEWSKKFLEAQIEQERRECSFGDPYICEPLNAPFWEFFGELKDDFVICWDNVDKVYFTSNGTDARDDHSDEKNEKKKTEKRGTLTYEAETHLSKRFDHNGEKRSLLEREIKIADPDVIVFAVGPYYAVTLDAALGITDKDFDKEIERVLRKHDKSVSRLFEGNTYPTSSNCIVKNDLLKRAVQEILGREIPVFWTYHPAYLHRNRKTEKWTRAVKTIKDTISQR